MSLRVHEALVEIFTDAGLPAFAFEQAAPPPKIVIKPQQVDYTVHFGGLHHITWLGRVLVGRPEASSAMATLWELEQLVVSTIEQNESLNGNVSLAEVTATETYEVWEVGGIPVLGFDVVIQTYHDDST